MNLSGSPLASARSRTGARSRCHPCRWVLPPSPACSPKRTCLARASGCAAALPRMFRSVPLACLLGVVYRTPGSISLLLAWSTSAAAADRSGLLIARASARGRLWPLLLSKGIAVATGPPDSAGLRLGLGEVRWTLVEKGQAGRSGTHTGSSETSGVGKRPELWRRSDLQREVRRLLHCLVPVQNGLGIRFRMPSLLVFRLFRGPDEGVPLPDGSKVPDAEVPHQGVLGL